MDITRLISRAGREATGVDRVELAYLSQLVTLDVPLFAIARTTLGYVLLDRAGGQAVLDRIEGRQPWGTADALSHLARRKPVMVRRAESDLRRLALARTRPRGLRRMIAKHLPKGTAYVNTGHSNLTDRMLKAVHNGCSARISVLIHDVIPMDWPDFQRPDSPQRFAAMLRRVQTSADLVIYNSDDTRHRAEARMAADGRVPPGVVAHLGVPNVAADPSTLPPDLDLSGAYFVTVGTIEPRKRHDLLLDVWDDMAGSRPPDDLPKLLICGHRGWNNQAVFDRLDAMSPSGPVRELSDLNDGAVAALVAGAQALLFPSEAEGFGLPPMEATLLGTPVVCLDLPIYREVLGDIPIYATKADRYQWKYMIENLEKGQAQQIETELKQRFLSPTWENHFNTVLRYT